MLLPMSQLFGVKQHWRAALGTRGTGPVVLLVRFGLILVPVLVGVLLYEHFRRPATPIVSSSAPDFATAFALPPAATPAGAENSNSAAFALDSAAAAKLMIPPPPQTAPSLQNVDPRQLASIFKHGKAAMESDYDDETKSTGARQANIAAILGYEPARVVLARGYPQSQIVRATVSSSEAVRYSLDPLIISGPQSEANQSFVALLAAYFSGRHEFEAYANDLLAALSDDRRLQTADRLQALLNQLSRVSGACIALSRVVIKAQTVSSAECSSALQLQIQKYLSDTAPAGLEAESRRQALLMLVHVNAAEHAVVR
jgi:hypothetical protein